MKGPLFCLLVVLLVCMAAGLILPTSEAAQENLLQNPGFEEGYTGWGGPYAIVSTPVRSGVAAAVLECTSACAMAQFVAGEAGAGYTFSAWTLKNNPNVQYVRLRLECYDAGFVLLQRFQAPNWTLDSPSFVELALESVVAPPDTHRIRVVLESAGGGRVYFDDAALFRVSEPLPTHTPTQTPTPTHTRTPTITKTPTASRTTTSTGTSPPVPTTTPTPTDRPLPTALPSGQITINEFLYRPNPLAGGGTLEARREWIELYNSGSVSVDLSGWSIDDGEEREEIPGIMIPPGGYVVLAGSIAAFLADYPDFTGAVWEMEDGSLGNGLANTGDSLLLIDLTGRVVDAISYGNDKTAFDPPCPTVPAGHSQEREPAGYDTDQASDFVVRDPPTPGEKPLPTSTPTATRELRRWPTLPLVIFDWNVN